MAVSDSLDNAYANLLRVIPRPLTVEEADADLKSGTTRPCIASKALYDAARRFVDAISPAMNAELGRRGTLAETLTGNGSKYLTAKQNAKKALRKWKPPEPILQQRVNWFKSEGSRELVGDVREEYEHLTGLLSGSFVPDATRPLLEAWRDAAWSIVSQGENESLDGCYWLLHADRLQHDIFVPVAAPEVRQAAEALVSWCKGNDKQQDGNEGIDSGEGPPATKNVRPKKSTAKGDAEGKITAALTLHHEYQDGGCLNQDPIGVKALARQSDTSPSSVSGFFNKQFNDGKKRGHAQYQRVCSDAQKLITALKMLNGEFTPSILSNNNLPGENNRDDD